MSRKLGRRPSVGFVFLVSAHLLLISLLAWGYTTPELDRVWLIQQGMHRDNFDGLSAPDVQTIKTALRHYPDLPRAFIGRAPFGFVEPAEDGWVSAGIFVFQRQVFDYLQSGETCVMEREPMERLVADGQLAAYRHAGFFFAMDTYREYEALNKMWESGQAPWKTW